MSARLDLSTGTREEMAKGLVVIETVQFADMIVKRVRHEPGWRWSEAQGTASAPRCAKRHVGVLVQGRMEVEDAEGCRSQLAVGDVFGIAPGHDAWVVGGEAAIMVEFGSSGQCGGCG